LFLYFRTFKEVQATQVLTTPKLSRTGSFAGLQVSKKESHVSLIYKAAVI
jgi:hypothetical protein